MSKFMLEVCVDSVASAMAACQGGADRLEVCANLIIGGTTPTRTLFMRIQKVCRKTKVYVLIRPRFGDFCYTKEEEDLMVADIKAFMALGAEGIVVGALTPEGYLNKGSMKRFIAAADNKAVTLNRAFDVARDPIVTLQEARNLGVHTILTSGQEEKCVKGLALIKELVELAGEKIEILVAGGVSRDIISQVHRVTTATAYHMSGKETIESEMIYRKEGVPMGLPSMSEFTLWQTSQEKVKAVKTYLMYLENGGS